MDCATVEVSNTRRKQQGVLAVNLGLAANMVLAALKTSIGIIGHSPALLADGINSVSDVAYYVVVSIFVRLAYKPADEEHPYGHHQLESIGALIVGSFVITTAVTIFWESVNEVYELWSGQSEYAGASAIALWVALVTIGSKLFLTLVTRYLGNQTHNAVVLALAYDHRNDVFTASAATLGIFLGRAGYRWVDPLAGALVALVVLRTGIEILRESASNLMDTVPGKSLADEIRSLLSCIPGLERIEEIKAHRFGPYLMINLTIGIDGALSVHEGDRIATTIEQVLRENIQFLQTVHIHYHPAEHLPRPAKIPGN